MNHLTLCTTMWDMVTEEVGYNRLDELSMTGAWREMISQGAGSARISSKSSNAKAEAETIVMRLIRRATPVELAIQGEIIGQQLTLEETSAGKVLITGQRDRDDSARDVKKLVRKKNFLSKLGCVIQ